MTGRLTVCATPIGNLGDAPPRLREVLQSADVVLAEDTRRARILLDSLGAGAELESYFVGNEAAKGAEIHERLSRGEHIALLTDAGTPAISDPGLSAVRVAREAGAEISVVPGPSAATAALSVSGFPAERFVFEGFLPRRGHERAARLADIGRETRTVVLFAAPSRLTRDLTDLIECCGSDRPIVVARELTKLHEEIWAGSLGDALAEWTARQPKGEYTLVLGGAAEQAISLTDAVGEVRSRVAAGESLSRAVREVAEVTGTRRRELYEAALRSSNEQ